MKDRGDPMLTKRIKLQKPIKQSHRENGETRCILKSRSGCKNSKKIWWMMKYLNTETLTPVLLMKCLYSPHLREVRICVNTVFILISLKTEIARSARGRKSQGPRAEDAKVDPYLMLKMLVTWWRQITRSSVTIANLETITDMQSWCRTYPLNGSKRIRAKQKLHRKLKEACKSSWSPIGSLKSFTMTIPWNSAKLVKNPLESLRVYTTPIGD